MAAAPRPPRRVPPLLVGAGVLVIAAGFGLPKLLPAAPAPTVTAPAPAAAAAPVAPAPDLPNLGAAVGRFVVCLVVVCGLCIGVARLVNKPSPPPPAGMAVSAALPVAGKCTVYLVTAGDRRLLVGTDAGGVKAVVELPGPPPEVEPEPVTATAEPVVVGPVRVPAPTADIRDDIAELLERLRRHPVNTPPG